MWTTFFMHDVALVTVQSNKSHQSYDDKHNIMFHYGSVKLTFAQDVRREICIIERIYRCRLMKDGSIKVCKIGDIVMLNLR